MQMQSKDGRKLNESEAELMAGIDAMAVGIKDLVEKIKLLEHVDRRWAAEGTTDLQKGLMSLRRAVTRPELF